MHNHSNEEKILEQLKERKYFSLGSLGQFINSPDELSLSTSSPLFLMSPSDVGVYRNGGRRGGQFAPLAVWAVLKKMVKPPYLSNFQLTNVTSLSKEEENFSDAQSYSAQLIHQSLQKTLTPLLFHLGGGHDHIYPLLVALEKAGKNKLTVINIDAHCDTRIDSWPHSGNPFRQFAQKTQTDFHLIQVGIHYFANDPLTLGALEKGRMTLLSFPDVVKSTQYFRSSLTEFMDKNILWEEDRTYVLSLDCDALDSSFMEGVSAVNHHGLPLSQVKEIFQWYGEKVKMHFKTQREPPSSLSLESQGPHFIYGIYEYNPLFDNLSQKGARALAGLIYQVIEDQKALFC